MLFQGLQNDLKGWQAVRSCRVDRLAIAFASSYLYFLHAGRHVVWAVFQEKRYEEGVNRG